MSDLIHEYDKLNPVELCRNPAEILRLMLANKREDAEPVISDAEAWVADPRNFALVEGNDLSLFMAEGTWPGPLHGHIFFASRGRKALETAKRMLDQAFAYGATEILGETPAQYRDALMFVRLLGFKEIGRDGETVRSRLINNCAGREIAA